MKQYKVKRKKEEQALDMPPKKLGVKVEGAERVRAKELIRKELMEIELKKKEEKQAND